MFLAAGWPAGDSKIANTFLQYFQSDQAAWVCELVGVLVKDCKKGTEFYQIYYGEVNVIQKQIENSLIRVIEKFLLAHQVFADDKSRQIVDLLTKSAVFFKNSLRTNVEISYTLDNESLINSVQSLVFFIQIIKTMDFKNYPKGENHIIQSLRKEDFVLFNIKNLVSPTKINNLYGVEKKLEYNDSRNDKITINNQEALLYALIDSAKQYYDEYLRSLQLLSKQIPNPFILPQVEVKFIVSDLQINSFSHYNNNYTDITSQFINHKEVMIRDLANSHSLPVSELETIYSEFFRISRNRRVDGRLNKNEFLELMSNKIRNFVMIDDFFNSIDEGKTGFIDFRGFVAAVGVLRSSNIERKLLLAFNAYTKTESGYMHKSDLYSLLENNDKTKNSYELTQLVNMIYSWFDSDRDGKLSFLEFKNAYNSNFIILNSFWTGYFYLSFDETLVPCIQCAKKIVNRGNRNTPGKCESCLSLNPSPRHYL